MEKRERTFQFQITLSLDQGRLQQHVGEEDSDFYERLMKETTVTDLLNGLYGKFKASVSVFDEQGAIAWSAKPPRKASNEAVGG